MSVKIFGSVRNISLRWRHEDRKCVRCTEYWHHVPGASDYWTADVWRRASVQLLTVGGWTCGRLISLPWETWARIFKQMLGQSGLVWPGLLCGKQQLLPTVIAGLGNFLLSRLSLEWDDPVYIRYYQFIIIYMNYNYIIHFIWASLCPSCVYCYLIWRMTFLVWKVFSSFITQLCSTKYSPEWKICKKLSFTYLFVKYIFKYIIE